MSTAMLNKEMILSFLRDTKQDLYAQYGVKKIGLFGSYARGEETTESDIDLAFEMDIITFKKLCALKHFLEDHFQRRVDLCSLPGMRLFIKRSINEDLVFAC